MIGVELMVGREFDNVHQNWNPAVEVYANHLLVAAAAVAGNPIGQPCGTTAGTFRY